MKVTYNDDNKNRASVSPIDGWVKMPDEEHRMLWNKWRTNKTQDKALPCQVRPFHVNLLTFHLNCYLFFNEYVIRRCIFGWSNAFFRFMYFVAMDMTAFSRKELRYSKKYCNVVVVQDVSFMIVIGSLPPPSPEKTHRIWNNCMTSIFGPGGLEPPLAPP